ncbi:MAG: peptide chain release factor N(5)-glutamine methyltransferase [Armatimonadetes bacterium]|nr:peptide chain release factor N(5)-glutamine methyltransferase [Armatimonadota bacterium]
MSDFARDAAVLLAHLVGDAQVAGSWFDARVLVSLISEGRYGEAVIEARRLARTQAGAGIVAADERLIDLFERLTAGEPAAYLTGERWFYGMRFEVGPGVLIPRPETELLVELFKAFAIGKEGLVVDAGTGSGCVLAGALSVASGWRGIGIDSSAVALEYARRNLARFEGRFELICSDWRDWRGRADAVLSNPPYISLSEYEDLDESIRLYEPREALAAGIDGLDAVRELAPWALGVLRSGGLFACEIGAGQGEAASEIVSGAGFVDVRLHQDLAGLDRAISAFLPG